MIMLSNLIKMHLSYIIQPELPAYPNTNEYIRIKSIVNMIILHLNQLNYWSDNFFLILIFLQVLISTDIYIQTAC